MNTRSRTPAGAPAGGEFAARRGSAPSPLRARQPDRDGSPGGIEAMHSLHNELLSTEALRSGPVHPAYPAFARTLAATEDQYVLAVEAAFDETYPQWRETVQRSLHQALARQLDAFEAELEAGRATMAAAATMKQPAAVEALCSARLCSQSWRTPSKAVALAQAEACLAEVAGRRDALVLRPVPGHLDGWSDDLPQGMAGVLERCPSTVRNRILAPLLSPLN